MPLGRGFPPQDYGINGIGSTNPADEQPATFNKLRAAYDDRES